MNGCGSFPEDVGTNSSSPFELFSSELVSAESRLSGGVGIGTSIPCGTGLFADGTLG